MAHSDWELGLGLSRLSPNQQHFHPTLPEAPGQGGALGFSLVELCDHFLLVSIFLPKASSLGAGVTRMSPPSLFVVTRVSLQSEPVPTPPPLCLPLLPFPQLPLSSHSCVPGCPQPSALLPSSPPPPPLFLPLLPLLPVLHLLPLLPSSLSFLSSKPVSSVATESVQLQTTFL